MPLIKIHSNVEPPTAKADALLKRCSTALAEQLGKPERYVMTCLMPHAPMTFAGTSEPTCYVEVKSIGTLSTQQTQDMSASFCRILSEGLEVPPERIYLEFADAERHLWGWNGKTFA